MRARSSASCYTAKQSIRTVVAREVCERLLDDQKLPLLHVTLVRRGLAAVVCDGSMNRTNDHVNCLR